MSRSQDGGLTTVKVHLPAGCLDLIAAICTTYAITADTAVRLIVMGVMFPAVAAGMTHGLTPGIGQKAPMPDYLETMKEVFALSGLLKCPECLQPLSSADIRQSKCHMCQAVL